MARVAYGDENSSPAVKVSAAQIRSERDGRMLNLYSMLLNAPPSPRADWRCSPSSASNALCAVITGNW